MKYAAMWLFVLFGGIGALVVQQRWTDAYHSLGNGQGSGDGIELIGDSWVAGQKLDGFLEADTHRPVVSFGFRGAKSREIYEHILKDKILGNAKDVVIVAGTNDTVGHAGADYYAHHMAMMARLIHERGMNPVLVSCPRYFVAGVPKPNVFSEAKRWFFKNAFDHGQADVIDAYRAKLRQELKSEGIDATVIEFSADYPQDYKDPEHLNASGSAKLAHAIAESIH